MSASTSPAELLSRILADEPYSDDLVRRALAEDDGRTFFSVVIERLGDLFEPRLTDAYARLFTRVMRLVRADLDAETVLQRYSRVRRVRQCMREDVRNIFVLSRITLGADVAVTSVVMDSLQRRYPKAEIHFVGPRKNWELFAGSNVQHVPFSYPRSGSLAERLSCVPDLNAPNSIVVDPDSRLTQLGLLPVCPEEDYFFFESRSYGAETNDPLPVLASRWCAEVFGTEGCSWVAPLHFHMPCDVAVSFGVGANEDKRIADPFEEQMLRLIARKGLTIVVDSGAGGAEAARIRTLQSRNSEIRMFQGGYAAFASMISQARLYVGYDSAGQHVAAATGVPLVSIFAGYPSDRMFHRWCPYSAGPAEVIRVGDRACDLLLQQTDAAIDRLICERGGQ